VIAGRRELNFDDWQTALRRANRVPLDRQIQREVSRGDMPPSYFLWLHPEAKVDDRRAAAIDRWVGEKHPAK
jgi:hypothetical protein